MKQPLVVGTRTQERETCELAVLERGGVKGDVKNEGKVGGST